MTGLEIVTASWLEAQELMYQNGPPLLIVNKQDPNSVEGTIDIHELLGRLRHLQADFDGTLTQGKSHWVLLGDLFPEYMDQEVLKDRRLFVEGRSEKRELSISHPWTARAVRPHQSMVCILMRDLERIVRAKMHRREFRAVAQNIKPREGSRRFCRLFQKKAVISAGIHPVIAEYIRIQGLGAEIAAVDFRYDNGDRVCGYDFLDVVHPGNKDGACWVFTNCWWGEFGGKKPDMFTESMRTLRIGDSPVYDAKMFETGFVNALIIPSDDGVGRGQSPINLDLWSKLSFIYRGDSWVPLVELIQRCRKS